MDEIIPATFADPDRQKAHDDARTAVETDAERLLAEYCAREDTFHGRYICADSFKELFPAYSASRESRNLYNNPVHNPAAVLAAELFRRTLAKPGPPEQNAVLFLTGIPGAGKTSTIVRDGALRENVRAVFEGQLARAAAAIPKIQAVINAGLRPVVVAVHAAADDALRNTFQRFQELGRGASLHVMAQIQGGLPAGLAALRDHFADQLELLIFDVRDRKNPQPLYGWENLDVLRSEGTYEQIRSRLQQTLEQHRAAGAIDDACYRQASGAQPLRPFADLDCRDIGPHQADERGRGIPEGSRQADPLTGFVELKTMPEIAATFGQGLAGDDDQPPPEHPFRGDHHER